MCLTKLQNLNNHKYTYVQKKFWKVVYADKRYLALISPIFNNYVWKPEWNCSFKIVQNKFSVYDSIHVFRNKKEAEKFALGLAIERVVIPVYGNGEDLIAYGKDGRAAFSKVFLKKEDYERAMKLCE